MAEDTESFYLFTVKRNESYEDRMRKRSDAYSLEEMLNFLDVKVDLGEPSEADRAAANDKLKIAVDKMRKALAREIDAIQRAISEQDNKRATAYAKNKTDKDGKEIPDSGGKIGIVKDFFAKEDKFYKDHEDRYNEYKQKLSEVDTPAEKTALQAAYVDDINAYNEMVAAQEKLTKLYNFAEDKGDILLLSNLPSRVQENLLKNYRDTSNSEDFKRIYNDVMSDEKNVSDYVYESAIGKDKVRIKAKDASGHEIIQDEHRITKCSDGSLAHSIRNLSNTGLTVSWRGGKLGILQSSSQLTEEQAKALAKYCFDAGIDFDNYKDLEDLKIVDKEGNPLIENGEPVSAAKRIQEEMKSLHDSEDAPKIISTKATSVELGNEGFARFLDIPKPEHKGISALEKFAVKSLGGMGYHTSDQLRCTHIGNKTIISVYLNEDDMHEDGKLDANGNRKRTKQFAVTLEAGPPASGSIYMPAGKELKANHARVLLDAFKSMGYKYVTIPGAFSASKPIRGAFLQACAKTLLVPAYNKDDRNTVLGEKDLETIFKQLDEEIKDEPTKYLGNGNAEFYMRLAVEVEKAVRDDKVKAGQGLTKLKVRANFENFNLSYKTALMNFINNHHAGEGESFEKGDKQWDDADYIAAVKGMRHLIKDLQEGRIRVPPFGPNDKQAFDPLDNDGKNIERLEQALVAYMAEEKPKVLEDVANAMTNQSKEANAREAKLPQALGSVLEKATKELQAATNSVTATGCEVKIDNVNARLGTGLSISDFAVVNDKDNKKDDDNKNIKKKYVPKNIPAPTFKNANLNAAARSGMPVTNGGNGR